MPDHTKTLALTDAAARLRVSYPVCLRLALVGELELGPLNHGRRTVTEESVRQMLKRREAERMAAAESVERQPA